MAMIQPDYNTVNLLCVIFSQGLAQDNPSCKKFTRFLISRAQSRGYQGDIIPVFKEDKSCQEMVASTTDLASYLCVNDLREMFLSNKNHKKVIVSGISEISDQTIGMLMN